MWRYAPVMPLNDGETPVSLGEGLVLGVGELIGAGVEGVAVGVGWISPGRDPVSAGSVADGVGSGLGGMAADGLLAGVGARARAGAVEPACGAARRVVVIAGAPMRAVVVAAVVTAARALRATRCGG